MRTQLLRLQRCLALALLSPLSSLGVFEWSYRDFARWKTKGQCARGNQSPIDIVSAKAFEDPALGSLKFTSSRSIVQASMHTNLHTWEVRWPQTVDSLAKLTFAGQEYALKSFHYRSPSENTIDGQYYAMEVQHVHAASDGRLLVVSVMMDIGIEANPYLDWYLWPKLSNSKSHAVTGEVATPYEDFMPENKSFFHWVGSLTTPPCTTNATWILLQTPVNISAGQLTTYRTAINAVRRNQLRIDTTFLPEGVKDWDPTLGINIRPTQPLGLRKVGRYTILDDSREESTLEKMNGWFVMLSGLAVGIFCMCSGMCLYSCFGRRAQPCGFDVLGSDSRTISRTNSAGSLESGDDEEESIAKAGLAASNESWQYRS